jgi:hypothetical protein
MVNDSNGVLSTLDVVALSNGKSSKAIGTTKKITPKVNWVTPRVAKSANATTFDAFLKGEIPGVVLQDFLSNESCDYYARKALEFGFESYKDAPTIGLIGKALVDAVTLSDYLHIAELMRETGLHFPESIELLERVIGKIALMFGRVVKILEYKGKKLWAGNLRLLSGGAGIHLDDVTDDCPELANLPIEFQGSFVLHLATPDRGGETILYEKGPQEGDKENSLYITSGWKYDENVVKDVRKVVVPAITGNLVLLPTQRYHSVNPSSNPEQERISFSAFFVVLKGDPTIYFYS